MKWALAFATAGVLAEKIEFLEVTLYKTILAETILPSLILKKCQ